nr:hypothetical protein [Tanacetum cinerariifolium]
MKESNKVLDLNIQCSLEIVKDGQIDTIDIEPQNIIGLASPIKVDNVNTKSGYTNMCQKDKQGVATTCSHTRKQSLVSELGGRQGDKEIIDLNIEFGLESVKNSDPNTMVRLESVTEFGSISQNDKRKRPAICSYVGNRNLVVDVGGHEYGLRGCAVEDNSTSVGSAFVNDTPGKHFVLDFENFGVVTSIPRTPGFIAAFGSHSAIAPDIDLSAGCKCHLPSLGAIAATDIPSSMVKKNMLDFLSQQESINVCQQLDVALMKLGLSISTVRPDRTGKPDRTGPTGPDRMCFGPGFWTNSVFGRSGP